MMQLKINHLSIEPSKRTIIESNFFAYDFHNNQKFQPVLR